MALEDIIQSIKQKADQKADEILKDAKTQASKIAEQYAQQLAQKKEDIIKVTQQKSENKVSQGKFTINNKIKTEVLKRKKEHIDKIYEEIKAEFADKPNEFKKKFFKSLLDNIPDDNKGSISAAKSDLKLIKEIAKATDIKVESDTVESVGGFIYTSPEMNIDYTLESIIDVQKRETEIQVSGILFE